MTHPSKMRTRSGLQPQLLRNVLGAAAYRELGLPDDPGGLSSSRITRDLRIRDRAERSLVRAR
jgi:hypothetical protein